MAQRKRKANAAERAAGLEHVVEHHATMVSSSTLDPRSKMLAKAIERAMTRAVEACNRANITDADLVRERILDARAEIKQRWSDMSEEQRAEAAGG